MLSSILSAVGVNLLSEMASTGFRTASRRAPVQRAIDTTSDRFRSRFPDVNDALRRWIDSDSFRSDVEALKNGVTAQNDDAHVVKFILQSALGKGTTEASRAKEVLVSFYTELWIALCGSADGLQVVGARIGSMDEKLDAILGKLDRPTRFPDGDRQRTLLKILSDKSDGLKLTYEGALRVLDSPENPARLLMAAHSIREMMGALPKVFVLPVATSLGRLGDQVNALELKWDNAQKSQCRHGKHWSGQIDKPIQELLGRVEELFRWRSEFYPKRRGQTIDLFRQPDPFGLPLPKDLEKLRADRWLELHDYFVATAHSQPTTPDRFDTALHEVEQYLIDTLQPQPSEDLDAIDSLLKGKSNAK